MDEFLKGLGYAILTLGGLQIKHWVDKIKAKREATAKKMKEEAMELEKKTKTSIEYTALLNELVKNIENNIMKVYRPVRMFMFHFYNGEITEMNLSLKKIAIRHEITLYPGLSYVTEHYQGRPIPEMFYEGIQETFRNGHYEFGTKHIDDNPPLMDFYRTWNIKSMLWISINNKDGNPSAILAMAWPGEAGVNYDDILQIKKEKIKIEDIYNKPIQFDRL